MQHRDALIGLLTECVERAEHEPLSLGAVLDRLEQSSFGLVALVLCLPFMQPLTLGPLSGVGGFVLASLGWQMMKGRETPWLPQRIYQIQPGLKTWKTLLGICRWLVNLLSKITRVRLTHWTDGRRGMKISGGLIALGGVLLAIPMPIAPFNNTLPALAMIFAAVAILERDGLMILVSIFWHVATVAYFTVIFALFFIFGSEAVNWIQTHLPQWG